MRTSIAAALAVLVALPAGAAPKAPAAPPAPAKKSPPACGVKVLPLVLGNTWTYEPVAAPAPAPDAITRIAPAQPKQVVVTVTKVDAAAKGDTTVTLEEKITTDLSKDPKKPLIDTRTLTTTIVCSATKFDISPESIFFAGEPGGVVGLALDKVERKGTSWKLTAGAIGDAEWREDLTAKWARTVTPGSEATPTTGKLELERVFTPGQTELIITKLGSYKAGKLFLKTTGRVTLDGAPADLKPMELPDNWINSMWIADAVGPVQLLNSYAHMYQLVDAKLN